MDVEFEDIYKTGETKPEVIVATLPSYSEKCAIMRNAHKNQEYCEQGRQKDLL